jgi:hypothetical protein
VLNTIGFSHALPKSNNLLTGSFDIDRAVGNTLLRKFDLSLSTFEGISPREGALTIPSTVIPSLTITASSELYNVLNFSSKALTSALTSSIPTLLVRLTYGDIPNPHSY